MEAYLEGLNEQQRLAVEHREGPLLILAGAGSGKTRVITCRIACLIRQYRVEPFRILAITFTNKAANEMKERVASLVEHAARDIWISTFHSFCVKVLREHISKLGFQRSFTVYDASEQQAVIKECLKTVNVNEKNFPPRQILSVISRAKDQLQDEKAFAEKHQSDYRMRTIGRVYEAYQQKLKQSNALDFDDLIMHTVHLFEEDESILEYYARRFQYIMVDEYQDTNHAQFRLIKRLGCIHDNLCVVGDDDQSIYGWRGADITNILDFEKEYPQATVIKLERNYRSTQRILDAAHGVISQNVERKKKHLWTDQKGGDPIQCVTVDDETDEANTIVEAIEEKHKNGADYKDMAILYRMNAQSRALENALRRHQLHDRYVIYRGLHFFERKEVKDFLAYLQLIVNPSSDVAFLRAVNEPRRGIGKVTLERLADFATSKQMSLFDAVQAASESDIGAAAHNKLRSFTDLIESFMQKHDTEEVSKLAFEVLEKSGLQDAYEIEKTEEARMRIENMKEFISDVVEYENNIKEQNKIGLTQDKPGLDDYLMRAALSSDADTRVTTDDSNERDSTDKIALMTLHSAKGLEFDHVFLPGFEHNVLPGYRAVEDEHLMEEERRLCYVGFTRARKSLMLTHARHRTLFGRTSNNSISCFYYEIPQSCFAKVPKKSRKTMSVSQKGVSGAKNTKTSVGFGLTKGGKPFDLDSFVQKNDSPKENFQLKDKVFHPKFGDGIVSAIDDPDRSDGLIEIEFESCGVKRFVLNMVNLEKRT